MFQNFQKVPLTIAPFFFQIDHCCQSQLVEILTKKFWTKIPFSNFLLPQSSSHIRHSSPRPHTRRRPSSPPKLWTFSTDWHWQGKLRWHVWQPTCSRSFPKLRIFSPNWQWQWELRWPVWQPTCIRYLILGLNWISCLHLHLVCCFSFIFCPPFFIMFILEVGGLWFERGGFRDALMLPLKGEEAASDHLGFQEKQKRTR